MHYFWNIEACIACLLFAGSIAVVHGYLARKREHIKMFKVPKCSGRSRMCLRGWVPASSKKLDMMRKLLLAAAEVDTDVVDAI